MARTRAEPVSEQKTVDSWGFYIVADLKTWTDHTEDRTPLEHLPSFEEAKARFEELRNEGYNSKITAPGPDGQSPARLTLGLESADGIIARVCPIQRFGTGRCTAAKSTAEGIAGAVRPGQGVMY